jgi:HD-GYP domain-containing protein (c-di-GMP phosphodiesterase class II)
VNFDLIRAGGRLNFQTIADKVQRTCAIIQNNRSFLLGLQKAPSDDEDYLAAHSVMSMIISIIIGFYLKLAENRVVELGVAALFHEVGMLKISPSIYLKQEELTPKEWKTMALHTLLGYKLLKSFDFPLAVSIVALEHHECENGSGYPQKLTGDKISLYSKIVSVACSYEALSARNPYRHGVDRHTSMVDFLKNNGKQYNDTVVKSLLYSLSLYPIGLYVQLSNKKKAQVIDVNPENPRFPIVQLLGEITSSGQRITIQTAPSGVYISGLLSKEEVGF